MTDKLFNKLWLDALSQPDEEKYIAEYGYPDFFDEISNDIDEIARILKDIHKVAHMDFSEILKESGLSQRSFSEKFCISLRTVQNWSSKGSIKRKCPDWARLLFCKQLGIITIGVRCENAKD